MCVDAAAVAVVVLFFASVKFGENVDFNIKMKMVPKNSKIIQIEWNIICEWDRIKPIFELWNRFIIINIYQHRRVNEVQILRCHCSQLGVFLFRCESSSSIKFFVHFLSIKMLRK